MDSSISIHGRVRFFSSIHRAEQTANNELTTYVAANALRSVVVRNVLYCIMVALMGGLILAPTPYSIICAKLFSGIRQTQKSPTRLNFVKVEEVV